MKENKITGEVFNWGPLLWKTKISSKDIKKLKELGHGIKYNKYLAGVINKEYQVDSDRFNKIIYPYIQAYTIVFEQWYNKKIKNLYTNSVWINYMKKGEFNPPHIHTNCKLSSVLFLDIPKKLIKEKESFVGEGVGPGGLNFFISNPQDLYKNGFELMPETGDFFIFPWNLMHCVSSFTSDITRISMAANFSFDVFDKNVAEIRQNDDK